MLEKSNIKESVSIESEFQPAHQLAWKMIVRASPKERTQMEINGSHARKKLKREVMHYLHDPIQRQWMNETIEMIADEYLQKAKSLELSEEIDSTKSCSHYINSIKSKLLAGVQLWRKI